MGKRKSDDLDFMAPAHLGPAQDDDFFTAPVKAARQRQAAQGHGPGLDSPYPGPPTPITPLTDNFNNNIVGKNDNNINQYNGPQPSSGSPFTPQELNFLTHYILEKHSKYKSMILAGYKKISRVNLTRKANNIIYRYEVWAGQAQKVFRQSGLGEVRSALQVDKLLDSKSERSQLRAAELLAKILRATAPPEVPVQGVKIIINLQQPPPGEQPVPLPPEVPGQPADSMKRIPPPSKPLRITK